MDKLISYMEQKMKYYTPQKGNEYFDGMLAAYEDMLDLCQQLRGLDADHPTES